MLSLVHSIQIYDTISIQCKDPVILSTTNFLVSPLSLYIVVIDVNTLLQSY